MKTRILIADDSKFSRKLIQEIVESAGHDVIDCVSDGVQALDSFKSKSPDVVLLDITMPNMSGKECLAEILKTNHSAKVVMISALTKPSLESECLSIGAKAFLSKSMNEEPDAFRNAILETIRKLAA